MILNYCTYLVTPATWTHNGEVGSHYFIDFTAILNSQKKPKTQKVDPFSRVKRFLITHLSTSAVWYYNNNLPTWSHSSLLLAFFPSNPQPHHTHSTPSLCFLGSLGSDLNLTSTFLIQPTPVISSNQSAQLLQYFNHFQCSPAPQPVHLIPFLESSHRAPPQNFLSKFILLSILSLDPAVSLDFLATCLVSPCLPSLPQLFFSSALLFLTQVKPFFPLTDFHSQIWLFSYSHILSLPFLLLSSGHLSQTTSPSLQAAGFWKGMFTGNIGNIQSHLQYQTALLNSNLQQQWRKSHFTLYSLTAAQGTAVPPSSLAKLQTFQRVFAELSSDF